MVYEIIFPISVDEIVSNKKVWLPIITTCVIIGSLQDWVCAAVLFY